MEGWDSLQVGSGIDLRAQGALIRNYWASMVFGNFLSNKEQHVYPTPKSAGQHFSETLWGVLPNAHRASPHTIWCRKDTPQQAIDNHPGSRVFYEVGKSNSGQGSIPPFFGVQVQFFAS
jgi:hypothetical protein